MSNYTPTPPDFTYTMQYTVHIQYHRKTVKRSEGTVPRDLQGAKSQHKFQYPAGDFFFFIVFQPRKAHPHSGQDDTAPAYKLSTRNRFFDQQS